MAASVAASALNLRAPRTWSGRCMRNRETPAGFKPNQPKTDGPTGGLTYPLNASKSCRKPSKTHLLGSHKIGTKSSRTDGWKHFQAAGFEKAKAQKDRGRNLRTQTAQNWNLRTPRQHAKPCSGRGWNAASVAASALNLRAPRTWSGRCMRNRETPAGFKPNQPKTDGPTGGLTYPLNASKSCRKPSKTHRLGTVPKTCKTM